MKRPLAVALPGLVAAGLLAVAGAAVGEPTLLWADETRSPRPARPSDAREKALAALCPAVDAALSRVAARLAGRRLPAQDMESVAYALRVEGDPHVWPRAWTLAGSDLEAAEAASRMKSWLSTFRDAGQRRCGIATARDADGNDVLAAVALDAQADLARVPTRVRVGEWITIDASILVRASGTKVIVLGPTGAPRPLLTSFDGGHARARFNADHEGTWLAQVLVDGETGPRPVLEAYVFAGVEPPSAQPIASAPGEEAGAGIADLAQAITAMVASARASESIGPVARDAALDALAQRHAARMMAAHRVGHDVGDGDPRRRIDEAGIPAAEAGENVAHAATITLAHRALWSSPSHRGNLLAPRFDRLGVGVATDADGSVWVTEAFVSSR